MKGSIRSFSGSSSRTREQRAARNQTLKEIEDDGVAGCAEEAALEVRVYRPYPAAKPIAWLYGRYRMAIQLVQVQTTA